MSDKCQSEKSAFCSFNCSFAAKNGNDAKEISYHYLFYYCLSVLTACAERRQDGHARRGCRGGREDRKQGRRHGAVSYGSPKEVIKQRVFHPAKALAAQHPHRQHITCSIGHRQQRCRTTKDKRYHCGRTRDDITRSEAHKQD